MSENHHKISPEALQVRRPVIAICLAVAAVFALIGLFAVWKERGSTTPQAAGKVAETSAVPAAVQSPSGVIVVTGRVTPVH